jgi:hypothetical protein
MTNEEAYKFGFLLRCAEEGLSPDQINERVKQAALQKSAYPGENFVKSLLSLGKLGLFAGPPVAGVVGGYALAKSRNDEIDPAEAKKRELIAEYRRALDQFNRSQHVQELA